MIERLVDFLRRFLCKFRIRIGHFEVMERRVGKVVYSEPFDPIIDESRLTEDAINYRKKLAVATGQSVQLRGLVTDPGSHTPDYQFPKILSRILLGTTDAMAMKYIRDQMSCSGNGAMFGKSSLYRIWFQFGPQLDDHFSHQDPPINFREDRISLSVLDACSNYVLHRIH